VGAITQFWLAARARGLGLGWVSILDPGRLSQDLDIPDDWRRIRVIDFGYRNAFVCQWWTQDHDGNLYMYREIYCTGRLVEDHARQIVALSEGENIEVTIADHDIEDRETLHRHGVDTDPAVKPIRQGIEAVQARMRFDEGASPSIFFMRDSLVEMDDSLEDAKLPYATVQEFPGYVYPKGQNGKPKKEIPIDKDNHGMDCVRYLVMYVDGPQPEFLVTENPFYS